LLSSIKITEIAVVIPCYNYSSFLDELFQSILNQKLPPFLFVNVLFSDNLSEDNSFDIAAAYSLRINKKNNCRMALWRQNTNIGAIANLKFLLDHANSDYTFTLCADDYLCSDHSLALMVDEFLFYKTDVIILGDNTKRSNNIFVKYIEGINSGSRKLNGTFLALAVFFFGNFSTGLTSFAVNRRAMTAFSNAMNHGFYYNADLLFLQRLVDYNCSLVVSENQFFVRREHALQESKTLNSWDFFDENFYIYDSLLVTLFNESVPIAALIYLQVHTAYIITHGFKCMLLGGSPKPVMTWINYFLSRSPLLILLLPIMPIFSKQTKLRSWPLHHLRSLILKNKKLNLNSSRSHGVF